MKKFTGRYTTNTAKALKGSEQRIFAPWASSASRSSPRTTAT